MFFHIVFPLPFYRYFDSAPGELDNISSDNDEEEEGDGEGEGGEDGYTEPELTDAKGGSNATTRGPQARWGGGIMSQKFKRMAGKLCEVGDF